MKGLDFKLWRVKNNVKAITISKYIKCSKGMLSLFENDKANFSDEKLELYKQYIREFEENKATESPVTS